MQQEMRQQKMLMNDGIQHIANIFAGAELDALKGGKILLMKIEPI